MVWSWGATRNQSVYVGGKNGTVTEAQETSSWPNYEAAYLAKRLGGYQPEVAYQDRYWYGQQDVGGWDAFNGDEVARYVYLDKVASDFREEADECLKGEFVQWLQGTHEENGKTTPTVYTPTPGMMQRRAIFETQDGATVKQAGESLTNWKPTWWRKNQLTHLDGVRDFLREKKIAAEEHEFALNVLAEFGPSNINQAWTYFKHWVKGRPVKPEECVHPDSGWDGVDRSGPTWMANSRSNLMSPPTTNRKARDWAKSKDAEASKATSSAKDAFMSAQGAKRTANQAADAANRSSDPSTSAFNAEDAQAKRGKAVNAAEEAKAKFTQASKAAAAADEAQAAHVQAEQTASDRPETPGPSAFASSPFFMNDDDIQAAVRAARAAARRSVALRPEATEYREDRENLRKILARNARERNRAVYRARNSLEGLVNISEEERQAMEFAERNESFVESQGRARPRSAGRGNKSPRRDFNVYNLRGIKAALSNIDFEPGLSAREALQEEMEREGRRAQTREARGVTPDVPLSRNQSNRARMDISGI